MPQYRNTLPAKKSSTHTRASSWPRVLLSVGKGELGAARGRHSGASLLHLYFTKEETEAQGTWKFAQPVSSTATA